MDSLPGAAAPDTRPKPFVFVLMPFRQEFDDVYQLGIRAACQELGLHCERVDEQQYQGTILDRIYNQIVTADVVVSDMSGKSPNVFYETGYAHALGKTVILCTRDAADIPFDLAHYPHVVYEGRITRLKEELGKRLAWAIEHRNQSLTRADFELEYFVRSHNLRERPQVVYLYRPNSYYSRIDISVSVHNPTSRLYDAAVFEFALLPPADVDLKGTYKVVHLPDGNRLYLLGRITTLPPDAWDCLDLVAVPEEGTRGFMTGEPFEFVFRVFGQFGPRDFPFTARCAPEPA